MHLVTTISQIFLLSAAVAGLSMPRLAPRREPHPDSLPAHEVSARSPSYKQPDKCKVVKKVIHDFGQEKAATAFCSAYLHLPKVTSTVTVTSYTKTIKKTTTITSGTTTKTVATNTATATVSKTITEPATVPTTTTVTEFYETDSTQTITSCAVPTSTVLTARAYNSKVPTVPKCLKGYTGGKVLSSACKCLDIPKATTTTTKTKKACTTKIISVTVPATVKVTATTTATATATTTTTSTSFSTSTATDRVPIYTKTVQVLAVPTFQIYVKGGRNNGKRLRGDSDGFATNDDLSPGTEPLLDFTLSEEDSILTVVSGPFAGSQAKTDPDGSGAETYVKFGESNPFVPMPCEISLRDDGTCPMICQGSRGTTNFDCGTYWRVASDADAAGCQTWISYAVS